MRISGSAIWLPSAEMIGGGLRGPCQALHGRVNEASERYIYAVAITARRIL